MADNVAITAGSGTTIATNDIGGGIQVQRIKVTWGPSGTANDADVASGKPLPTQLRNSSGTETPLPSGLTAAGGLQTGRKITNPTSVLTRPANTTAYSQDDLIAGNTTAGSIVVPTFTAAGSAGAGEIRKARLYTDKTSGWDHAGPFVVDFWSAAPTFTNGDNGAYAVATGAASWLGSMTFSGVMEHGMTQAADGAYIAGAPDIGDSIRFKLASGTTIAWSLRYTGTASLSPASGQTFTLVPEIVQD